jgi:hypothetical protein
MRHVAIIGLAAAVALPLLAACESAPRVRNVEMGPVDTGTGSVEAVRRQLHGNWELVTLDLVGAGGVKTPVEASARLQYDDYGNMSIRGSVTGSQQIDPSVLNLTGQVAIDPAAHTLRFQRIAAKSADERRVDPKLDAAQVRYYEFTGNILTTTIKDAAGAPTAIATWKKID